MPQCLNKLEEINGKTDLLNFNSEKTKIILDIYNEPKLKSLNVSKLKYIK